MLTLNLPTSEINREVRDDDGRKLINIESQSDYYKVVLTIYQKCDEAYGFKGIGENGEEIRFVQLSLSKESAVALKDILLQYCKINKWDV